MKMRIKSKAGFSLVEVSLALGVVVFCLITIMGLLALGVSTTKVSIVQTSATNILSALVSDLQSTPNPLPHGSARTSLIYGIAVPTLSAAASTTPATIYIGEDGQVSATAANAMYRLSVWTTGPTTTKQETLIRLLLSWPAAAAYTSPKGYLESVVALNRT